VRNLGKKVLTWNLGGNLSRIRGMGRKWKETKGKKNDKNWVNLKGRKKGATSRRLNTPEMEGGSGRLRGAWSLFVKSSTQGDWGESKNLQKGDAVQLLSTT